LSARLGARREAEDAALALEQAQAPPDTLGIRTDLAREIRALVSIDAGRPEEALQLLEDSRLSVDILPRQFFALFYTRPLGRLLRAQLLQQLGRDEEALAWYANFAVAWGTEYVFNAPRYLGMAEVYERRETTSGPQSTTDASWRGGRMRTRSTSRWFRTCVTG
jgi:hypothetical protein